MKQTGRVRRRKKIERLEAEAWYRPIKRQVSVRLDADVLAWFKRGGRGYQTRINQALRKLMQEQGGEPAAATKTGRRSGLSKIQ